MLIFAERISIVLKFNRVSYCFPNPDYLCGMHIASVIDISKSFGIRQLFSEISFHIEQGDKIGLIARNGSGKTTLLKILSGLEPADSGKVWVHKETQVVFLPQETSFNEEDTILDQILGSNHPVIRTLNEYENYIESGQADEQKLTRLIEEMDRANAWGVESTFRQILGQLHLHHPEWKIRQLSGGQKKRVALARAILETRLHQGNCLLLLDEPTNHLDIAMIEWLEEFLSASAVTLLMITHDRYFLDSICNRILEMDDEKIYSHQGNYDYYLEQQSLRREVQKSELLKDKNIYRRELEWMRKQPKARTVKSRSRQDAFKDIEKKVQQHKEEAELELRVKMSRLGGKVLEMKKVYKQFGERVILKGFDYTFKKGERLGIVGSNGIGKSTFLRIALQQEAPDSGKINHGETVVFGYFGQEGLQYKEDKRSIDFVKGFAEFFPLADGSKVSAGQFMELFGFTALQQYTPLSKLSGGEKRRLQLLSILFSNPNFLVMDEPTNDLDIQTLRTLEEFLMDFAGCIMIVSHDRYFMDRMVDHLLVFKGGGEIMDYPGNYSQFRASQKKEERMATAEKNTDSGTETKAPASGKKLSFKEKFEMEKLEKQIPELQNEKARLESLMSSSASFEEIDKASREIGEIMRQLDEKEMRWLELSEKRI